MSETPSRRDVLRRLGITAASLVAAPTVLPELLGAGPSSNLRAAPRREVHVAALNTPPSELRLPWSFLSKVAHDRTQTVYVHAVDVTLDYNFGIDSGKHLTVYADVVRLTEMIQLPGRDVYIFARRVIGGPSAGIDVSGASVSKDPPVRVDGLTDGASGKPGDVGALGGNGGRLTIYAQEIEGSLSLQSNGGDGGKGQDGGKGHKGAAGANGADADRSAGTDTPGTGGGPGGAGGAAGLGGDGGPGGAAGEISLNLLMTPAPAQQIAIQFTGGRGGPPGATGQPGDGGPGGVGGRNVACHWTQGSHGGERTLVCEVTNTRANSGIQGPRGGTPNGTPQRGADGASRDRGGSIRLATSAELGERASLTALSMRLHHSELDYLRGQFADAAAPLVWILTITSGSPGTRTPQPGQYGSPSPAAAMVQASEWAGLRSRAQTLSSRLTAGLDYYGQPWDFVPLVHIDQFDAAATTFLDIAKAVEDAHAEYWDAAQGSLRQRNVLLATADSTTAAIQAAQHEISEVVDTQTPQVLDNLSALDSSLADQQQALFRTDAAFQDAVRRLHDTGCGFQQLVRFVGAVVALTSAASPVLAALPADLAAVNPGSSVADVIKQVKKVAGDMDSLRGAYQGFQASIDAGARAQKILVSLDDFERTLAPYIDELPEARQYRDQMRTYVATSLTRNAQLLLYTSLVDRRTHLEAIVATQQGERERVNALIVNTQDPALAEYDAYMGDLNVEAKRHAIDALYFLRRALEYRGVRRIDDFDVNDQDVAALRALHGRLHNSRLNILSNQAGAKQRYNNVVVRFTAGTLDAAFQRFRAGTHDEHRIALAVPWDAENFQRLGGWGITASQVDVVMPRVRVRGRELFASLPHPGTARLLDQNRHLQMFSHTPRGCRITRPLSGTGTRTVTLENNLGGEPGFFAEVSPFAAWELRVSARDNPGLNLGRVSEIQLVFSGSFVPFAT